jgi:hypothetical protein
MNSSCNRRTSVSITPCVLFTYIESSEMNNELQGSPSVAARPTAITITHELPDWLSIRGRNQKGNLGVSVEERTDGIVDQFGSISV